ncbi:MAG: GDSL-type esterase/lipase family protein [Porcipelethomonas sp.]
MKKILSVITAALMALSFSACGSEKEEKSSGAEISKAEPSTPEFGKYVSNTVSATGNNKIIESADNVTYRAYFPVEEYGEFEYCFYFSNAVDSTWGNGRSITADRQGGEYTIVSASVGDGGTDPEKAPEKMTKVTFEGSDSKNVTPGEAFWSDSVSLTVDEGDYLVWEWTLTGTDIPCTNISGLTPAFSGKDGNLVNTNECPLPQMIGCNREVKLNIAAIGDSITQGCETTQNEYKFWVSQISESLGIDYSMWNLGLGYARASDAAQNGNWLQRAANADVVIVAFGTNDIVSGKSIDIGPSSAEEIEEWTRTIVETLRNAGCRVILFNAPPFDLDGEKESTRQAYNAAVPKIAEDSGADFFDFASYLSDESNPSASLFGGHPNDEGCSLIAQKFTEQFSDLFK